MIGLFATPPPKMRGKPLRVFVKYFTKFLKIKHCTVFYKGFNDQRKIFSVLTKYFQVKC